MSATEWDELRDRQLEWRRQNPEPKHTPGEVCDCAMPSREVWGDGHCAVRGPIITSAEIAVNRAAKEAGIVIRKPVDGGWYSTIRGSRMPGEFGTADEARDAAMIAAGVSREGL